ncbi:MAG: hypothetical protein GY866_33020 [Proteobacteria bacterium]|nr:hypothetical protein [Pseudomonadota bacterium]
MNDEIPGGKSEKFQNIENRITHLTTRDTGVKTSYSELRNFHPIICNDVKMAICKRLSVTMTELEAVNGEYLKTKFSKKEHLLAGIAEELNQQMQHPPDVNPQNTQALFAFLRELSPIFIRLKAQTVKEATSEKKEKRIKQLEAPLKTIDRLSLHLNCIYMALVQCSHFERYLLVLIRAKYNKDDVKELIKDIHDTFKETFKVAKKEILDIDSLRIIDLMTMRIVIRLGIYECCTMNGTYLKILNGLPRQIVQQFNTRYQARRREADKPADDLKSDPKYMEMTKKFLNVKLKKFYTLLRVYQLNMGRLFTLDETIREDFREFVEEFAITSNPKETKNMIADLQSDLNRKIGVYFKIFVSLPKNDDLKKNSINRLNSLLLNFYHGVLKDTFSPPASMELAIKYIKQVKPPKELMFNSTELNYLNNNHFKRDENILKIYFEGILNLATGEEDENEVIKPLLKAIELDYVRSKKLELRQKALDKFIDVISPDEIDFLVNTLETLPTNKVRIGTNLGKFYLEITEKYLGYLKRKINQAVKIEPTDQETEKLRKTVTEKFDKLLLKVVGPQVDKPSSAEVLKKTEEEEQAYLKATGIRDEMLAQYNIGNMIAYWKTETVKSVIDLCRGSQEKPNLPAKYRELDKNEIKIINAHFTSEYLGEMEKHYKVLSENIGQNYLMFPKPYFKIEFILLFAAKHVLVELRNPAKAYPRVHERINSISVGSK